MHLLATFTHFDNGTSDFLPKLQSDIRQVYRFARAMKSSCDLVGVCADAIASDRSRETKRPELGPVSWFIVTILCVYPDILYDIILQ